MATRRYKSKKQLSKKHGKKSKNHKKRVKKTRKYRKRRGGDGTCDTTVTEKYQALQNNTEVPHYKDTMDLLKDIEDAIKENTLDVPNPKYFDRTKIGMLESLVNSKNVEKTGVSCNTFMSGRKEGCDRTKADIYKNIMDKIDCISGKLEGTNKETMNKIKNTFEQKYTTHLQKADELDKK